MMSAARRVVLPVLCVLALGACSSSSPDGDASPAPTPTPTPSATAVPTTTSPGVSPTSTGFVSPSTTFTATERSTGFFVAVARGGVPELEKEPSEKALSALANQICDDLAAKKSGDAVVSAVTGSLKADDVTIDQATARELIKAAIDSACLDQASRVDEF